MIVKEINVSKSVTFNIGQQYDHMNTMVHFKGLSELDNKYIFVKCGDYSNEIPLVDDSFVVGRPLTLNTGDVKAQILARKTDGSVVALTPNFTMCILPSNYDISAESEDYPEDPNIKNWYVKIEGKITEANQLIELVQKKLDDGDFVGPQGPKGDKGDTGTSYEHSDEFESLANRIHEDAENVDTSKKEILQAAQDISDDAKFIKSNIKSAVSSAQASATSASNAKQSEDNAKKSETNAGNSATEAKKYSDNLNENLNNFVIMTKWNRSGKLYGVKKWKSSINPTSTCEKTRDNVGLVCKPSTDTVEGQDDYADIPLFKWKNVNYKRYSDGFAYPTAFEGEQEYNDTDNADVGCMQMTFYYKEIENNEYYELIISDSPNHALGLEPWPLAVRADGIIMPYFIQSKYISSLGSDGLLHSLPGKKIKRDQSHNNMLTNYQKKGEGYWGAGADRLTFAQMFSQIKYATKDIQSVMTGCTGYAIQYKASVQSEEKNAYFPVTKAQANNIYVDSCVSVGYGRYDNSSLNLDRSVSTIHKYADDVKVLKKEDIDENNIAIYIDCEPFSTKSLTDSNGNTLDIYITSMQPLTGTTDKVIGQHDGSYISNTNYIWPCRIQGIEYFCGSYIVASDTVMLFNSDYSKDVYYAPRGVARQTNDSKIKSTYTMVGTIPANTDGKGSDYWIGDVTIKNGIWYPSSQIGTQNSYKDRIYAGGTATSGSREYLQGGTLRDGSSAGLAFLFCWSGLAGTGWNLASAD